MSHVQKRIVERRNEKANIAISFPIVIQTLTLPMRLRYLFYWLILFPPFAFAQTSTEKATEITQKVEKLLSQMTLAEKVGQMPQITLNVVSVGTLP